uniref:Zinc finger, CCHC-type n=1 Tax=Tanacetum cinerariifolium TaxID=118510 RepID=A0A6L2M728_TANCI|nr:zinc finger, CCHC-type [Tanacetum cinerariifolium]
MHKGIAWDMVENINPQSTPQILLSFEENIPPVTYPDEVEKTIGLRIEVEPLDETPLGDLGLNTCNQDTPLSSREILSFDGPKPQPQPFPRFSSLVDLGEERDLGQPIKPPSLDSFRMKEVDYLTIHTPPSPYVISFHPKDMDLFIPVSGDGGTECTPRVVAVNVHQRVDGYSFVTHRVSKLKDTIKGYSIRGKDGGENPTVKQVMKRAKWDNDDYVYRGLILNVTYWKCGKPGHLKKDCKAGNVGNRANRSSTKGSEDGSSNPLKGQNRCWFKTYESLNDGYILHMGNESTSLVHGRGCVDLSDLCDLHATPSLGNKKYFMAFIDDASRFYVIEPNDLVAINSIIESRDAIFNEHRLQTSRLKMDLQKKDKDGCEDSLNGDLEEEVYMNQPLGIIMHGNENKVCKLIKSLYGLKQAPKQWHQKFNEVVLSNCYLLNQTDKYVYSKFDTSGKRVIICLYVDDMMIFGTNQVQVDLTKEFLSSRFSMKDMGEGDVIMGIRIKHESNCIAISQSHYIKKVLKKFNYFDCTPVSTPLDTCENLMPNRGLAASQLEYSRVIGCLMYAMTYTRPDIAIDVGKLSRLVYSSYPSVLEGYIDASWINNTEDNSSTSGWVFLLGGGAISWASKKQICITGSTMESKFMALAAAGKEAEWLKNLLFEIPLWVKPMAPISIRCDSAATLVKAYNQMYNGKSRHLGVRHSMIRELIMNGVVSIEFVRSQQNLADHLTNGLSRDLVIKSAKRMGLKSN